MQGDKTELRVPSGSYSLHVQVAGRIPLDYIRPFSCMVYPPGCDTQELLKVFRWYFGEQETAGDYHAVSITFCYVLTANDGSDFVKLIPVELKFLSMNTIKL